MDSLWKADLVRKEVTTVCWENEYETTTLVELE